MFTKDFQELVYVPVVNFYNLVHQTSGPFVPWTLYCHCDTSAGVGTDSGPGRQETEGVCGPGVPGGRDNRAVRPWGTVEDLKSSSYRFLPHRSHVTTKPMAQTVGFSSPNGDVPCLQMRT